MRLPGCLLLGALGLAGCGGIAAQSVSQQQTIGPVAVQTTFCLHAFGGNVGTTVGATSCPERPLNGTGQVLLGYEVPVGSPLPSTFSVTVNNGFAPITPVAGPASPPLAFTSSPAYASALAAQYTTMPGEQWYGYVSDETRLVDVDQAIATILVPLPSQVAGMPYPGPLTVVTALGDRITSDSGSDDQGHTLAPERPLDCQDPDTLVLQTGTPAVPTVSCFDDGASLTVATEDLAVVAPGPATVPAGASTTLPFALRWAGPADPSATFTLVATSSSGGGGSTTANPSSGPSMPVDVSFSTPPGTAAGNYTVTLTATSPGGATRTATATVAVTPTTSVPAPPPPPPPPPPPAVPVRETLSVPSMVPLATILARGLPVTIGCNQACDTVVDLLIYRPPAHRAGIARHRKVQTVLVGRAYIGLRAAGHHEFRLRPFPVPRARLPRLARVTVLVRTTAANVDGHRTPALLVKRHLRPDCRLGGRPVQPCISH